MSLTTKQIQARTLSDAEAWARGYATFAEAWAECERGNWMLALAGQACRTPSERAWLAMVTRECAVLAARVAGVWAVSLVAPSSAVGTATAAADAAAVAIDESIDESTARAIYLDAEAISRVAYKAWGTAWVAARVRAQRECADLVRSYYPDPPVRS